MTKDHHASHLMVVKELLCEVRRRLAANDPEALSAAQVSSSLTEQLPANLIPKTLPADLWIEARLLVAQAQLARGLWIEAARTALDAVTFARTEGSGDALLAIEMEATGALLAFADRNLEVSIRRWRSTQRKAAKLGEILFQQQAERCEVTVRALAETQVWTGRDLPTVAGVSHWIGVMKSIALPHPQSPREVVH